MDISFTPFLIDFVERNSFPISTILFVNWTLVVKSTLNRPSFGGASFFHSCPSPHSTNIWRYYVGKFYPNLFFWTERLFCTCTIFGVNPLLNFAPSIPIFFLLYNMLTCLLFRIFMLNQEKFQYSTKRLLLTV